MKKIAHALTWWWRLKNKSIYPAELDVITKYISKQSGTIIDIGAHGGAWSFNLAKIFPQSIVWGMEAFPYYAEVLQLLKKISRIKNVLIYNYAISDKPGILSIKYQDETGKKLTGFTHVSDKEANGSVDVKAVTVDELTANVSYPVTFIKCDVEGFERMVFKGSSKTLETYKPAVYCEINHNWCKRYNYRPKDVFDIFLTLGYKVYTIADGDILPFDKYEEDVNGDFLFLHP